MRTWMRRLWLAAAVCGWARGEARAECVMPPNGSFLYALIASNPANISLVPGCAAASVDTGALTHGTRTSATALPDACVIPASERFYCPGAGYGNCPGARPEDIITCDGGGQPLTQGAVTNGLPCLAWEIGTKVTDGVDPLASHCSACVQAQADGPARWIAAACPTPPSRDPAVHEETAANLTSCDGDNAAGSAFAFPSREDVCVGMGMNNGKFYKTCTAHPCPAILGSLWPNGKLRCNEVDDGGWMGTCRPGPSCRQQGDSQYFKGSQCADAGPDAPVAAVDTSRYPAPSIPPPPAAPPSAAAAAPRALRAPTRDAGPAAGPGASPGAEGVVARGDVLRDGYFAAGHAAPAGPGPAAAGRPGRTTALAAVPEAGPLPKESDSTSACAPATPVADGSYGPGVGSVADLEPFPARLAAEYDSVGTYLRELDPAFGDGRPKCLSLGAHLAYVMEWRLPALGKACGETDWQRPGLSRTWEGLAATADAVARCGAGAVRGECPACGAAGD